MNRVVFWIGALILVTSVPSALAQTPAPAPAPPVSITLGGRHAHVTPERCACGRTGGGNIDIQQPSSDTVVITMTGVAVAAGHPFKASSASMHFELDQCFEISFHDPKVKSAKLSIEGRVIGLLRGGSKGGTAGFSAASATICGATLCVEPHGVAGCDNQSVNCREERITVPAPAEKYTLRQTFAVTATHSAGCGKAASAEFAPDPALDPLWISHWEPFHGAVKKDFGFQVIVKVSPDSETTK